jgi:Cu(I)/Ag(I) efflux system membrane fusion protein
MNKKGIVVMMGIALAVGIGLGRMGTETEPVTQPHAASEDGMAGMDMQMGPPPVPGQATVMLTEAQVARLGVQTAPVVEQTLTRTVRAVGHVAHDERRIHHVTLRTEGVIHDLFVNFTGQEVRKGEPLFTLYSPELIAAQQEYLLALRTRDRLSETSEAAATSERLVASARARLALWQVLSDAQIQRLEAGGAPETAIPIHAPASGVVTRKEAVAGMRVTPEMTLYEISDLSSVWVLGQIYESDLPHVSVGQPVEVQLESDPQRHFEGRLTYIDPEVSPDTRVVKVRAQIPNDDRRLKPGMRVRLRLTSALGHGPVVPESAVVDSGAQQIVFVEEGMAGMYTPRAVTVGGRSEGRYLLTSGVRVGERIVTAANFLIDSESKLMSNANMMGALGMADWQMKGSKGMDMDGMAGMEMAGTERVKLPSAVPAGSMTRKSGDVTLLFSTEPSPPKDGKNQMALKIQDAHGQPVTSATVEMDYTMPMPGMRAVTVPAPFSNGAYRAKMKFGMPGDWDVTVRVDSPKISETFRLDVVP